MIAIETLDLRPPPFLGQDLENCSQLHVMARLGILANPGDQVILNVARLSLGHCTFVDVPADVDLVVNVPGKGPRVDVGRVVSGQPLRVLAPHRKVDVTGRDSSASATTARPRLRSVHARVIRITGGASVGDAAGARVPAP